MFIHDINITQKKRKNVTHRWCIHLDKEEEDINQNKSRYKYIYEMNDQENKNIVKWIQC